MGQVTEDARELRLVLDDQHAALLERVLVAVVGQALVGHGAAVRQLRLVAARRRRDRFGHGDRCTARLRRGGRLDGERLAVALRQHQGKGTAGARRTLHLNLAAQQVRQLAGDRQAQARAAITSVGGAIGLAERLEDRRLLLRRDADAGVAHREGQHAAIARLDAQGDRALLGELEGVGQQVLEDLLQALAVGEQGGRQVVGQFDAEAQGLLHGLWKEQALHAIDQPREDGQFRVHLELAGFHLGNVENVVDQGQQVVASRIDGAGELHLLLAQVAGRVVRQQLGQDQRTVQRRAQLVGHVGEELGLVAAGTLQLVGALLEHQLGLVQALVLLVHLVALASQRFGLLGQLFVGLLQLGLLLFHVRLRLAQGIGLLLQLLVGGTQFFLLHLQLLVELLGFGQHLLQSLAVTRRFDGRADARGDASQQLAVLLAQRSQEAQFDHAIEQAAIFHRHDQHRARCGVAQRRGHLEIAGRQVFERHHPPLQGGLSDQPRTDLEATRALQMFRVVGVFGDALQLAVLYHVQRADGGVDVAREEVQHALAQRRQRQFADDRLAQLGLAGAVPGLLFQRLGMRLLLAQRFGVGRRQRGQVTATEKDQQAAEDQAEQQEATDQRRGDDFRGVGTLGTQLALGGNEFVEQRAALVGQVEAAAGAHVLDDRLAGATPRDPFFGKGEPEMMRRLDLLDARQLQRVVAGVALERVQLLLDLLKALAVRIEERLFAGDQVPTQAGFQIGDQAQRFMGVGHPLDRLIDPVADAQQVIDDGTEEEGAEEAEAQGHGHVAIEDAPEIVLIDEGLAHLVSFPCTGAGLTQRGGHHLRAMALGFRRFLECFAPNRFRSAGGATLHGQRREFKSGPGRAGL